MGVAVALQDPVGLLPCHGRYQAEEGRPASSREPARSLRLGGTTFSTVMQVTTVFPAKMFVAVVI